ncbi:MAG: hypothetical protein ABSA49_00830 [Rhizomicrobium sp.]|jgi:hypothetical protein
MRNSAHRLAFAAATLAWLTVSACAPEQPYFGPKDADHSTGYTDEKLDQNRFRVTYTGNTATNRETVENFLLLRAAQVAQQAGSNYFMFDMRDTKAHTTYFSDFGWSGAPHFGWYWHSWAYDGFNNEVETRPETRFQAYAEIVLLTDAQASKEPRAIAAQSIVQRLGPAAMPPPPPSPR